MLAFCRNIGSSLIAPLWKAKESIVFDSENQNNYNYFGDKDVDAKEIMEKMKELDQEVEELKEFEVEAMEEFEMLKSYILIST